MEIKIKEVVASTLMLGACLVLNAQEQQVLVQGEFKSKDKAVLSLAISYNIDRQEVRDTIFDVTDHFTFHGLVSSPTKAKLSTLDNQKKENSSIDIYLGEETIIIEAENNLHNVEFQGSLLNADYQHFQEYIKEPEEEKKEVLEIWNSLDEEGKNEFRYEARQRTRSANLIQRDLTLEYIKEFPDSYFSLSSLYEMNRQQVDVKTASPLFEGLSSRLKKSALGKSLKEKITNAEKLEIGKIAPDFSLNNIEDELVSLSDFRGQYVLLDFWASWCGPCRAENPNLIKAYDEFKNRGFTVLGVSLDFPGKKQAWLDAIEKDRLPWTQLSDLQGWNSQAAKLYNIRAIPASFLIDPEGKIISKNLRGERLFDVLEDLLPKE